MSYFSHRSLHQWVPNPRPPPQFHYLSLPPHSNPHGLNPYHDSRFYQHAYANPHGLNPYPDSGVYQSTYANPRGLNLYTYAGSGVHNNGVTSDSSVVHQAHPIQYTTVRSRSTVVNLNPAETNAITTKNRKSREPAPALCDVCKISCASYDGMNACLVRNKHQQKLQNSNSNITAASAAPQDNIVAATPSVFNSEQSKKKAKKAVSKGKITMVKTPKIKRNKLMRKQLKKLLVLSVNGLLADIVHWKDESLRNLKPDFIALHMGVFTRPFCDDFLEFCLENFEVIIWSSRMKKNLDAVLDGLLNENIRGYFDGRCLPYTGIFPPPYKFEDVNDNSLGPGGDIREYLVKLAKADNVQTFIQENPFGLNHQKLVESVHKEQFSAG